MDGLSLSNPHSEPAEGCYNINVGQIKWREKYETSKKWWKSSGVKAKNIIIIIINYNYSTYKRIKDSEIIHTSV